MLWCFYPCMVCKKCSSAPGLPEGQTYSKPESDSDTVLGSHSRVSYRLAGSNDSSTHQRMPSCLGRAEECVRKNDGIIRPIGILQWAVG